MRSVRAMPISTTLRLGDARPTVGRFALLIRVQAVDLVPKSRFEVLASDPRQRKLSNNDLFPGKQNRSSQVPDTRLPEKLVILGAPTRSRPCPGIGQSSHPRLRESPSAGHAQR